MRPTMRATGRAPEPGTWDSELGAGNGIANNPGPAVFSPAPGHSSSVFCLLSSVFYFSACPALNSAAFSLISVRSRCISLQPYHSE